MKRIVFILLTTVCIFMSCKKEDPIIADPGELQFKLLNESFVCQPVTFENNIVSVTLKGNQNFLCSYDANGNIVWEQNIEEYAIPGYSYQNVYFVDLEKDKQDNIILIMHSIQTNQNQEIVNLFIKAEKFNQDGQLLWQLEDSIHQPDTIIIQQDTIDMADKGIFMAHGLVSLSDGNYIVVSSDKNSAIDSTYLQFTYYNNDGQYIGDFYQKIDGLRDIYQVYSTSDDHIFMSNTINGVGSFYLMLDLNANIIFDVDAQGILLDTYFFYENSQGDYLISAAYLDNNIIIRGALININQSGQLVDPPKIFYENPTYIPLSVQETSDGYIFSGFSSASLLLTGIDWRTSFLQEEHHAIILKTDLTLQNLWQTNITGNFYTAGAVSTGMEPISVFGGKYERTNKNIFILKLNSQGGFYN